MRWFGIALVAAFAALGAGPASAEGTKVDCADLDMQLKATDFEITCKDFSDGSALSNAGRIQAEVLQAISEKHERVIVVLDLRALGNIYLKRRGLEEDTKDFFSDQKLDEWKPAASVADFEVAEYANRRSGTTEEECIAFRRQMGRRNGGIGEAGFNRIVVGFGCTAGSRDGLIETLKQLDAPGG